MSGSQETAVLSRFVLCLGLMFVGLGEKPQTVVESRVGDVHCSLVFVMCAFSRSLLSRVVVVGPFRLCVPRQCFEALE